MLELTESFYANVGWLGVLLLMILNTASVPVPSQLIMPLAGWLLVKNAGDGIEMVLFGALVGTVGNLIGSLIGYWFGAKAARPFVKRFGKFLMVNSKDLDKINALFAKHGEIIVLFSRVIPTVRTFISMPAGSAGMNLWKFSIYTFIGCFPFVLSLIFAGYMLGDGYEQIKQYTGIMNYLAIAGIFAGVIVFVVLKLRLRKESIHA